MLVFLHKSDYQTIRFSELCQQAGFLTNQGLILGGKVVVVLLGHRGRGWRSGFTLILDGSSIHSNQVGP